MTKLKLVYFTCPGCNRIVPREVRPRAATWVSFCSHAGKDVVMTRIANQRKAAIAFDEQENER